MVAISALDALKREDSRPFIPTFSKEIDKILDGGIPMGSVTEICGMAGLGKTQLCMQLCANVQIPSDQGGIQGSAIYLDTEGSFLPKRMMQIAQATLDSYPTQTGTCKADVELDWSVMLQNIILYRATNVSELLASIIQIEQQLQSNSDIKLIVIDSIAFHFRSLVNFQERTRILNRITQTLRKLASQHQIAIVMTNQMTTKIGDSRVGGNSMMVPALGESFGHAATHRIILLWRKNVRHAWLCKSSTFQEALVPFAITAQGMRDS